MNKDATSVLEQATSAPEEFKRFNARVCHDGLQSLSDIEIERYNELRTEHGLPSIQEMNTRLRRTLYGRDDIPLVGERLFEESRKKANQQDRKLAQAERIQRRAERKQRKAQAAPLVKRGRGRPRKVQVETVGNP